MDEQYDLDKILKRYNLLIELLIDSEYKKGDVLYKQGHNAGYRTSPYYKVDAKKLDEIMKY